MRFNDQQMIRLGQTLIAVGIALLLLPGSAALPVGLVVIGLGCAPIYPCIIHETPANFGKNLSMAMTGIQMAAAYVGVTLLSPFFGVLAQNITMQLYPWALLAMLVVMFILSEQLHKKTAARRAGNQASLVEGAPAGACRSATAEAASCPRLQVCAAAMHVARHPSGATAYSFPLTRGSLFYPV